MIHPDLELLYKLAVADLDLATIAANETKANGALAARVQGVADCEAAIALLKRQADLLKRRQHDLQRRFDQYDNRRRGAIQALETGAGSADAAQRQLEQCTAILDDVETEQLEAMETQDRLDQDRAAAADALTAARVALAEAQQVTPGILRDIAGSRAEASGRRQDIVSRLPPPLNKRYEAVKARRGTAVAMLESGACKTCRTMAPKQQVADILRGLIAPCKFCGRWLVPDSTG